MIAFIAWTATDIICVEDLIANIYAENVIYAKNTAWIMYSLTVKLCSNPPMSAMVVKNMGAVK